MRNDFESNYLAHHGILGMKWGKRNGPPYPLGSEDHSAAEKKAGYKKSIGGGRNEELYSKNKTKNRKNSSVKTAKNAQLKKSEATPEEANTKKDEKRDIKTKGKKFMAALLSGGIGATKMSDAEKAIARDQKKFDRIKAKTQKLGEKVDSGTADMKTEMKWREQEKKYYKAINDLMGKYDLKNVAGVNDYADYKIVGKKDTISKSKDKYGNLGADIQDYLYANDPKKNRRVEKKINNISKEFYNDKRIKAVAVQDPTTGKYTGVLASTLKKKGKNAALQEVKDPEFLSKVKSIEVSYIDKYEKGYSSGGMGKDQAHRQAINRFSENTGYTRQTAEELYKKYSKK